MCVCVCARARAYERVHVLGCVCMLRPTCECVRVYCCTLKMFKELKLEIKQYEFCLGSLLDSAREIQTAKQMNGNQK